MTDPTFGVTFRRIDTEPRPVVESDMSTIGLVGTAPNATATDYPLDEPVLIFSDDATALAALGDTGTLPDAVEGVNAQLGDFQVAARIVIIRVAESTNADDDAALTETINNVLGTEAAQTGIFALLKSGPELGVVPRLIGCPGFTSQQEDANTANVVCAGLPAVLSKLLGVAVVDGPGTTLAAFTSWRETLSSDRLIPLETGVNVGSPAVSQPGSPRILGIAVRRDFQYQGRPFHSWANQPVQGIVAPNRFIPFSITDGATEGQTILEQNGGIIVRGEIGVESAIADGGFIYVGTDTTSANVLWQFYNQLRGRDFIHLSALRAIRFYLGRFNITRQTIQAIQNEIGFFLRDLKADEDILGYRVTFQPDQNTPEQLRLGRITVNAEIEEPPVLRYVNIQSARYRPALDALIADLVATSDEITG